MKLKRRQWLWQGSIALGAWLLGWRGLRDRPLRAEPTWSYGGDTGPDHWAALDPGFQGCATGQRQSPIDLGALGSPAPQSLVLDYTPAAVRVRNTGRSIFVDYPTGECALTLDDRRYTLLQFHLHHPSEHQRAGQAFPAEVHFVHRSEEGQLLVLGRWLTRRWLPVAEGPADRLLRRVLDLAPIALGASLEPGVVLNPADLLPNYARSLSRSLYRYSGSLTTPPCSEGVTWLLLPEPIEINPAILDRLAARLGRNARPLQRTGNS